MTFSVQDSSGESALESIEFLARSAHRIGVLEAVSDGPCDRNELREVTGASSPTVGRMLREFETRGWIIRMGQHYEVTPLGAFVAEGFIDLIDRMKAERTLRDIGWLLPIDEFDIDLRRLSDARLTLPNELDTTAPQGRWAAVVSSATDRLQTMTRVIDFLGAESVRKKSVENGLASEVILTSPALETVATDPELAAWAERGLRSGTITGYRCDAEFPSVTIVDGVVLLELTGHEGVGSALIESDDEAVVAWAEETFERYRSEAEPVDADVFAP